jgi:ABC-type multidrug transport system ATPase subunit
MPTLQDRRVAAADEECLDPVYRHPHAGVTAYVPQADIMHAHMTVRETIMFTFLLTRK